MYVLFKVSYELSTAFFNLNISVNFHQPRIAAWSNSTAVASVAPESGASVDSAGVASAAGASASAGASSTGLGAGFLAAFGAAFLTG